jgi:hypothetical protein
VPSTNNVADDATCSATVSLKRWWSGLSFLKNGQETWPLEADLKSISPEDEAELKRHYNYVAHINFTFLSADRFSTFRRLLRVTARVFQFARLLRDSTARCDDILSSGLRPLLARDISSANAYLLKTSQQQSFGMEFACLRENRALPKRSRLK